MSTLTDIWGNTFEVTPSYVAHRNRLIDVHLIHTFQTKGKRLLINTFKQNEHVPTMCVFFENKEKAEEAYESMKQVYYGPSKMVRSQPSDISFGWDIFFAILPMLVIMGYLFSSSFLPSK
jgi:hypothetical protein